MSNDVPPVRSWSQQSTRWAHWTRVSNFPLPMPNFWSGWKSSDLYLEKPRKGQWVQEMIVASYCKSRNGGHKTACKRNLAIVASALPANFFLLQPQFWAGVTWLLTFFPGHMVHPQPKSALELLANCTYTRQISTILALTYLCAYETRNVGVTSTETN